MNMINEKKWDEIRCLVVDDDRFARSFIFAALNNIGLIKIREAESADKALEFLNNNEVDIIFLDQLMPNKTGIDFIKELKSSTQSQLHDIPTIMVTNDANMQTISNAKELGVDDYVIKPISPLVLKKKVLDALGIKQEG